MKFIKEKGKKYMALLIVCVMMVGLFPIGVYAEPSAPGTPVENLAAGSYIDFGGQVWRLADPNTRYLVRINNLPTTQQWSVSGTNTDTRDGFNYLSTEFNNIITVEAHRDMIQNTDWDIRCVLYNQKDLTDPELRTTVNEEGVSILPLSINGKLGMLSIGERNKYVSFIDNTSADGSWTRTPVWGSTTDVYFFGNGTATTNAGSFFRFRPTLYLKSGITVAGGSGTVDTPYTLAPYDATQDNADITAAKVAIEGATYAANQAEAGDATAAATKAQGLVNALALEGTTATVVPGAFTTAVAGTPGTPAGTNGSFTFTVTINKGGGTEQTSEQQTMTIIATAYAGISDVDAVAAAKIAIETAIGNLAVSNATTAQNVLDAAQGATLHGVSVAWDVGSSFSKINATSTTAGLITGTLNLALNSTSDTVAVSKTITQLPSSGGGGSGGGGSTPPQQETGNTIVIVNGVPESAGTETKTTENGKSTTLVQVNNEIIESKIDEAIKNNTTDVGNVIQIPVVDKNSEVVKVELTGDIIKKLEENTFNVSVKNNDIEYIIPAEEFTISKVAETFNILEKDLKEIKVEVRITKLDEKVVEKYNEVAKANGAELVFPPVAFEVVAKTTKSDGTTGEVEISKFSNYVQRIIEIPAGVDQSKITTGIVFNPDGTYSHVPTEVFQKDGKWYASLKSLTNSNYSVVWNPVTVKSVENHWSKDAVNDMASRLIIINPESFDPNKAITRADFAEYIVRALGLYRVGSTHENKFKDVSATDDRTLAILIASEYGIVTGYIDATFRPDQQITREEAMAMYQRAMKVTKLTGSDTNRYQRYTDFMKVSDWAANYVKEVLAAHVFNGTSATNISPESNLTYAEAAQAIKNLLVESKLIN